MKKAVRFGVIMAVLTLGILAGAGKSQAKDGINKLKVNKVIKKYDVTADGKADKIKVVSKTKKKTEMNTMKIMINGKQVFKHKEDCGSPDVEIIQLEGNQTLISVFHRGMDDYGIRKLFTYAGSKWKKVMSMNATKVEYEYDNPQGSVTAVSGNAVTIQYDCQSGMVGLSTYAMDYLYEDGKMTLLTPIVEYSIWKNSYEPKYTLHETMKARMDLDVYDKVEEGRTVAFTIKAEEDVQFLQMQRVNGIPWYYVAVGDKKGWLECQKYKTHEYQEGDDELDGSSVYFHNAVFAG